MKRHCVAVALNRSSTTDPSRVLTSPCHPQSGLSSPLLPEPPAHSFAQLTHTMPEHDVPETTAYSSGNGHDPSLLPQIPLHAALSLSLPTPNGASSVAGVSTQSMRTSSFAMSDDISEKLSPFDSLRIRKAYSRPPRSRTSILDDDDVFEKTASEDIEENDEPESTDRWVVYAD